MTRLRLPQFVPFHTTCHLLPLFIPNINDPFALHPLCALRGFFPPSIQRPESSIQNPIPNSKKILRQFKIHRSI